VAVKIGSTDFYTYPDPVGTTNTTFYYWIRFVSKAAKAGPYNTATGAGTVGTTTHIYASSFATSGSFLSSAASAGATTLNLNSTATFASSGSGQLIDATNDRDAFSWTGKTATTLTGCSGVLAHPIGASVISLATGSKAMLINYETNETRFYGNRGDGIIEELASIGITQDGGDYIVGDFGSVNSTRIAIRGRSLSHVGVQGVSTNFNGVEGTSANGIGVQAGTASTTRGAFKIAEKSNTTDPTTGTRGEFYVRSDGVLRFHDGTSWKTVTVV
jgi:hypothetical protein